MYCKPSELFKFTNEIFLNLFKADLFVLVENLGVICQRWRLLQFAKINTLQCPDGHSGNRMQSKQSGLAVITTATVSLIIAKQEGNVQEPS